MKGQDKAKALNRLKQVHQRVPQVMASRGDFEKWRSDALAAIGRAFGEESHQLSDFRRIRYEPIVVKSGGIELGTSFRSGMSSAEAKLESMIEDLEYWEGQPEVAPHARLDEPNPRSGGSRKIFLVHGHDEAAKSAVEKFLKQLGVDTVILADLPSGGKTIIEKFEAHADVGYAVALLTADDVGSRQGEDAVQPRARQNVVFELGYFIGRLGRKRVCALTKGEPEIPSDYSGVVYISMDGKDDWQGKLVQELREAGINAL